MKIRIMQTNCLRGLLYEFGLALPEGHKKLLNCVNDELASAQQAGQLDDVVVVSIQEQLKRIDALQVDIDTLDRRLAAMVKQNGLMAQAYEVPGVGPLAATALIATVSDFATFKSGRQFAAWLGLTPRQVGTGGRTQQLGMSKRGDTYLRHLLISGARSVIVRSAHTDWLKRLIQRRHFNVVVVALANKIARTVWSLLVKGNTFDKAKWNPAPAAPA